MKIIPDQTKSYTHASVALEEHGFEYEGEFYGERNAVGNRKKYQVYWHLKKEKYYYFVGMSNFNTQIYYITMKPLPKPLGHYDRI